MSSSPLPPRLETERLLLRPWAAHDADALAEVLCESVEHLRPWIPWATAAPPTPAEVQERLTRWIDDYAAGRNWIYAIFDRRTEGLIGGVGLYPRVGPGALEIGYWIGAAAAGSGYATEATRAIVRAGFGLEGVERMEIRFDPANEASGRVPAKLGFRLVEIRRGEPAPEGGVRDTAIHELRQDDWSALDGGAPRAAGRGA